MNALNALIAGLPLVVMSFYSSGQVKRHLIIGRTSSGITLEKGKTIRVYGFASKLSEQPGIPGPVIEANEGDSVEIDFWNVSQGDPHDIKITGTETLKQRQRPDIDNDKGIRHMEHGYYSFVPRSAGTLIYYCPVNYPFNIQAGMVGIVIVRPGQNNTTKEDHPDKELLWCGYEIDTNWHTDSVLDIERGDKLQMPEKPTYAPQYFLINGKNGSQLSDATTRLSAKQGETILLRLANTGFMDHEITFPKEMKVQVLTKNATSPVVKSTSNMLILKPLDTYEVLVCAAGALNSFVNYSFKSAGQGTTIHTEKIPVLITKKLCEKYLVIWPCCSCY